MTGVYTNRLSECVKTPVFAKIGVSVDLDLVKALATSKVTGIVYLDTLSSEPYIDIYDRGCPFFDGDLYVDEVSWEPKGVLSGEALLHYTLSYTQMLHRMTRKPLLAGGGISHFEDLIRCIMLGASAVHVTSQIMKMGFGYIDKLNKHITYFMENNEYASMDELMGVSYQLPQMEINE